MTKEINFVYTGSFLFPCGYAGTMRVRNLMVRQTGPVKVLLFKYNTNTKGIYDKIDYYYVFKDYKNVVINGLLFLPSYCRAIYYLYKFKVPKAKNILYVYSGINIENIIPILFSKAFGYKILVDVVEDFSLNQEKVSLIRKIKISSNLFFEKHLDKIANGVIVISRYLERKFINLNVPILYLPVSANISQFERPKIGGEKKFSYSILYAGTYGKKDGVSIILKAFKSVIEKRNDARLVLTGNPTKDILNEISHLNIYEFIEFTGYLNDKDYNVKIHESDILLMTRIDSKYANAGFPFKLGEYLATGNPVIASKTSDVEEYLTNGENAFLLETVNELELEKTIVYTLDNYEKALEIGKRGKHIAIEYFNPDFHIIKLEEFIEHQL